MSYKLAGIYIFIFLCYLLDVASYKLAGICISLEDVVSYNVASILIYL